MAKCANRRARRAQNQKHTYCTYYNSTNMRETHTTRPIYTYVQKKEKELKRNENKNKSNHEFRFYNKQ